MLGAQPEFRYWLRRGEGWFFGAHAGVTYWNEAHNDRYRYQDHDGKHPAYGGGLAIGHRWRFNRHWAIEASVGGGVYRLYYDKFYNTPRTKDGLMIESIKKTYWGIDQAAVSFSYSFDLKKKGGKR